MGSLFAVDANGKPTDALTYDFVPVKGNADQVIVTVTLDNDYLTAADRAFPVVIDPTVTVSSSQTADTCVCSGFPTTNYYTAAQLRTGYDSDYGIRRSFIKFNIPSSIPVNSVTAARLDVEKVSGATPSIRARRVTGAWSSSTLTWQSHPSSTTVNQSPLATLYSSGSSWYTMDVTGIVQAWVNSSAANYGFLLLDMEEGNPDHWTTWYSSDAVSPHKPELYISYSIRPQTTFYYDLYRNSEMPNSQNEILNYTNTASIAIQNMYNVVFINGVNVTTSVLNQRPGCTLPKSGMCLSSKCGEASNCITAHHKSAYHFLDVVQTASSNKVIAFVDFALCRYDPTSGHERINGAARKTGQRMLVSLQSSNIQKTTCHEMSHLIGANDEVCSADQLCVMRYDSNVTDVWCTQCQNDIFAYLDSIS